MIYQLPQNILKSLIDSEGAQVIAAGRRGLEKESLRINRSDGSLAGTGHPQALGSALTHPFITTDFSEALLEFVTPALHSNAEAMDFLRSIHKFTYLNMPGEMLWPLSMPCGFSSDADVPLARYGTSNVATMKTVYRRGLGLRYGRIMQTISGVHFNYSLPDIFWPALQRQVCVDCEESAFKSFAYFALIRNFKRLSWLVLYLFGGSPAVCNSFFQGRSNALELVDGTAFGEHATSLRMSDIGYSNNAQAGLNISLNSLDEYAAGLVRAIQTMHPPYEKIGVEKDGKRLQLSTNILQISNEFYSVIRPKRVAHSGEKPTHALRERGVEYVEIRSLDLDGSSPIGVNKQQLDFMECLLLHCILSDSSAISAREQVEISQNDNLVATYGRKPDLQLMDAGEPVTLSSWADSICRSLLPIAAVLDEAGDGASYSAAVHRQLARVADSSQTPSATQLQQMAEQQAGYHEFGLNRAHDMVKHYSNEVELSEKTNAALLALSQESLDKTREIEENDDQDFETFLENYFNQD